MCVKCVLAGRGDQCRLIGLLQKGIGAHFCNQAMASYSLELPCRWIEVPRSCGVRSLQPSSILVTGAVRGLWVAHLHSRGSSSSYFCRPTSAHFSRTETMQGFASYHSLPDYGARHVTHTPALRVNVCTDAQSIGHQWTCGRLLGKLQPATSMWYM